MLFILVLYYIVKVVKITREKKQNYCEPCKNMYLIKNHVKKMYLHHLPKLIYQVIVKIKIRAPVISRISFLKVIHTVNPFI